MKEIINRIKSNKKILVGIILGLVTLVAAGAVLAQSLWSPQQITGGGTVTVNSPPPPPTVPSTYNFSVSPTTFDISGTVASGTSYIKTVTFTIQNTGSTGTDGGNATIGSIAATASGLPAGWTLSGGYSGTLLPGATATMDLVLTSPILTATVTVPSFTVSLQPAS